VGVRPSSLHPSWLVDAKRDAALELYRASLVEDLQEQYEKRNHAQLTATSDGMAQDALAR